jgi:hypothetical protein
MSDSLGSVVSAVSAGSSLLNFSVPWRPREKTLYSGNYVVAKVEGEKLLLTSVELVQLLRNGVDVEVFGYMRE